MAIRSAIQFGAGRDDDRLSPGFKKAATGVGNLFGGQVVTSDTTDASGKTIKLFNGQGAVSTTNPKPLGLVFESSVLFPVTNTANPDGQAGYGYDNINYARGGVYSVFHRPGNIVEVFDDGRATNLVNRVTNAGPTNSQPESAPFITSDSYVVGSPVYATGEALLTSDSTGATAEIGVVRAVSGSGAAAILTIELGITSL